MYKVEYTQTALKDLKKIDKGIQKLIIAWIEKNLINCDNPRKYGKSLTGDKTGLWRYRIGSYRLIANIEDNRVLILILNVGHRKNIYEK